LSKLFYAWTLFSVDEIDFDQIYLMLKILMPKAKPKNTITYHYVKNVNKDFYVSKKIHEVMANIHNKFGVDISEKE